MRSKIAALATAAALAGAAVLANGTDAHAQRWHGYGYRGFGPGAVAGLAAGALIGGAIAATSPWYGYGYSYGPGYGYGYVPAYGSAYAYSSPDDTVAYCESRFRSYNPARGTYLGYDGLRHACP
jgi:BA14K-like protein